MQTNVCYNIKYRKGKSMKGRVKWWSKEKGYGFIEYNNNQNIFVYLKPKDRKNFTIKENIEIEFEIDKNNFIQNLTFQNSQ